MAGRGPAPKPPDQRARRNKDPVPQTKVRFVKAKQPTLPAKMPDGRTWPQRTKTWWARWAKDPRSARFDAAAWDELLDTAVLHAVFWRGDWKVAAELRRRTEKFGVTPADRARLRIALDDGLEDAVGAVDEGQDETPAATSGAKPAGRGRAKKAEAPAEPTGARARYGHLRAVE